MCKGRWKVVEFDICEEYSGKDPVLARWGQSLRQSIVPLLPVTIVARFARGLDSRTVGWQSDYAVKGRD